MAKGPSRLSDVRHVAIATALQEIRAHLEQIGAEIGDLYGSSALGSHAWRLVASGKPTDVKKLQRLLNEQWYREHPGGGKSPYEVGKE